jgi:hypothetical protein
MTKVKMQLVGIDGNAFSIMGAFKSAARNQGWSQEEIKSVLAEAMKGDYNHLLATIATNVDDSDFDDIEDEEGCEFCGDCDCDGECEEEN